MDTLLSTLTVRPYAFAKVQVGSWWNFRNHISPFARIYLICAGEQHVEFGENKQHQIPGRAYLMPPFTRTTSICPDKCVQYYFIFSCLLPDGTDFFANYRCNYEIEASGIHYGLCEHASTHIPDFGLVNSDANSRHFNQGIIESGRDLNHHSQSLKLQGCILELLSHFMVHTEPAHRLIRFTTTLRHIESHINTPIGISELAELEGLTTSYFFRQIP